MNEEMFSLLRGFCYRKMRLRDEHGIERFKPYLGSYKLVDLRPEHFRSLYTKLRKQKNKATGKLLSEATVEGAVRSSGRTSITPGGAFTSVGTRSKRPAMRLS